MSEPRTDLRCGKCERRLAFVSGSWRHTDDGSLLCHFAIPYIDPQDTTEEKVAGHGEFGRIDFTYWPLTNEVEWHGHPPDDLTGDTPPMKVPLAMVKGALAHITEATQPKPKPSAPRTTFGCR